MKLVCTDLDRTLLPNGEQPESAHARPILWHLLRTHDVQLAYVSGRDLARVLDAIDEYSLPTPDAIVADVGTSVFTSQAGEWVQNMDWQARISQDWNGMVSSDVQNVLSDVTWLTEQEPDRQSTYKQSYYFDWEADLAKMLMRASSLLDAQGIRSSLVASLDPEKNIGLLDVLPHSATKREAVAFLQLLFNVAPEQTLFAGDSGNDVNAICAHHPSVLVANADASTREAVEQACNEDVSLRESTCMAAGDLAVSGEASFNGCYAAGIVEGLVHFRPGWRDNLNNAQWVQQARQPGNRTT